MKIKPRIAIFTAVTLALIMLVAWMLPIFVRSLSYKQAFPRRVPPWQGVLSVWQVSSWRVAKSSKSNVLNAAAKAYEKKHLGLYIEVENISEETYQKRIAAGQQPDILSYPAELHVDIPKCINIPIASDLLPIHEASYEASGQKAVPWLCTMPLILVNADLASRRGIDYVDDLTWESYVQLSAELKTKKDNHSWRGSPCTLLGMVWAGKQVAPPESQTPWRAFLSFSQRDDALLWGGLWEAAAMGRLNDRGKGFTTTVRLPPEEIPMMVWSQCLSIFASQMEREAMAVDFVNVILGDTVQQSAADKTGCMAVIDLEGDYSDIRRELLERSAAAVAIIPGQGLSKEQILAALGGDPSARAKIMERLVADVKNNTQIQIQ